MGNNIDEVIGVRPYQLDSGEGSVIIKDNCLLGTDQPELNSKSDENKGIYVVFEGEIYNAAELISELEARGHIFSNKTCPEIIVHLYEEYGLDCLQSLEGVFSLALWDKRNKLGLLGRDRMGFKRLYYTQSRERLLFSSQLKTLLKISNISPRVNFLSLDRYLISGYVMGTESIIDSISRLSPGYMILFKKNKTELRKYWDLNVDFNINRLKFKDSVDRFKGIFKDSLRSCIKESAPFGVFLSGGLDSSLMVAYLKEITKDRIRTFSIGFRENYYDESRFSEKASNLFDTQHYKEIFSSKDLLSILPEVRKALDEPLVDPSVFPTYFLSRLTRKYAKVAIGGEGADELGLGYPTLCAHKLVPIYKLVPLPIRRDILERIIHKLPVPQGYYGLAYRAKKFIEGIPFSTYMRDIIWLGVFNPGERLKLYQPWLREILSKTNIFEEAEELGNIWHNNDFIRSLQYLDIKTYLADDLLVKLEQLTKANSLQIRLPYLNHRLAEFMFSLPTSYKLNGFTTKYLLRRVAVDILPKEIINKKKQGFGLPLRQWIKEGLNNFVQEILSKEKINKIGLFDYSYIHQLINEHSKGIRDNHKKIWALVMFQLWYETYMQELFFRG